MKTKYKERSLGLAYTRFGISMPTFWLPELERQSDEYENYSSGLDKGKKEKLIGMGIRYRIMAINDPTRTFSTETHNRRVQEYQQYKENMDLLVDYLIKYSFS